MDMDMDLDLFVHVSEKSWDYDRQKEDMGYLFGRTFGILFSEVGMVLGYKFVYLVFQKLSY